MTVWPAAAPIAVRPIASPIVNGSCIHDSSQPRMRRPPHSSRTNAREPVDAGARRAAERVAVEVDEGCLRPDEGVAEPSQRIGRIERDRLGFEAGRAAGSVVVMDQLLGGHDGCAR